MKQLPESELIYNSWSGRYVKQIVEIEQSCSCAAVPFPGHYHNADLDRWLRRIWAHDCAGDGSTSTTSTFPVLKGGNK